MHSANTNALRFGTAGRDSALVRWQDSLLTMEMIQTTWTMKLAWANYGNYECLLCKSVSSEERKTASQLKQDLTKGGIPSR